MKHDYVLPNQPDKREFRTPLRGVDHVYLLLPDIPVAYVWPDRRLDPEELKAALRDTLDLFPVAAARIRYAKDEGRYEMSVRGSRGVPFEVRERDSRAIPSSESHGARFDRYFPASADRFWGEAVGIPLLSVRLTLTRSGGSILAVAFSHVLTDGAGMVHFLNVWNAMCVKRKLLSSSSSSPASDVAPPSLRPPVIVRDLPEEFEREVRATIEANKAKKEHHYYDAKDRIHLAGYFDTVRFLASMPRMHQSDEVGEFLITGEEVGRVKNETMEAIARGNKGEEGGKKMWVSSYEALASRVLRAAAAADPTQQDPLHDFKCRAIVNIRGRGKSAHQDYFGCAIAFADMGLDFGSPDPVGDPAIQFHEALRSFVSNPDAVDAYEVLTTKALLRGDLSRIWRRPLYYGPWRRAVAEDNAIMNSWVGFSWFGPEITFGGPTDASPAFMKVASNFRLRNHFHIYPLNGKGDCVLRVQLPPARMAKFKAVLTGEAGVRVVELA